MPDEEPMNEAVVISLLEPISLEATGRLTTLLDQMGVRYAIASDASPWRRAEVR